jgi:hypothetical protein
MSLSHRPSRIACPAARIVLLACLSGACAGAGGHPRAPGSTDSGGSGGSGEEPGGASGHAGGTGGGAGNGGDGGAGQGGSGGVSVPPDAGAMDAAADAGSLPADAASREAARAADVGVNPDVGAFVHPGVLDTRFELDFMKQQVAAGKEPWKTAYARLAASGEGSLNYKASPRAEVACGPSGQPDLGCGDETSDSEAVYAHALLWAAGGDVRHAQKTAEILDAWSAVLKSHAMSNAPLQIGWTGGGFVRAAEILRYTYPQWDKAHVDQFSTMMTTAFLPLIRNYKSWGTNGNWDDVMIEVMISIAVFNDDHALFDEALTRFKKRLPAYIYATADGATPLLPDPSAKQDLVKFWYGQTTYMDGLSQETCRDLRHVQHGFGGLIQTAEIAWHQGVDLYSERNNRLLTGLEFHAKYILGAPVPADLCGGTLNNLEAMPTFEIPYNHYHNRKKLPMPLSEKIVNTHVPEGAVQHMMYGTLSHHGVGLSE